MPELLFMIHVYHPYLRVGYPSHVYMCSVIQSIRGIEFPSIIYNSTSL